MLIARECAKISAVECTARVARLNQGTTALVLGCSLVLAIAGDAQSPRINLPQPTVLRFSPDTAGQQRATATFSWDLSKVSLKTEFAARAVAGNFRVVCTWDRDTTLFVDVSAAAGHGLPGRIGIAAQTGRSPITIEVQIPPEQQARGPVYVEIGRPTFTRGTGVLRGTLVASAAESGVPEPNERETTETAFQEGKLFSPSEVRAAEAKLKLDSSDWPARLSLLAYYSSSADLRMSKQEIIAARRRHILWAIENRPSAEDIFQLDEFKIGGKGWMADPEGLRLADKLGST